MKIRSVATELLPVEWKTYKHGEDKYALLQLFIADNVPKGNPITWKTDRL